MKVYNLKKTKNCDELLAKTPNKKEFTEIVREDSKFYVGDECIGVYINLPKNILKNLREATLTTKYVETYRTRKALPTKSSVFGALPRIPMRNDFCRLSNKTYEEKENMKRLMSFQKILCDVYKEHLPELYNKDLEFVRENVDDDYRLVDTPYTTVNINVNHAIKYHKDNGNVKGSYSNVLILKEKCYGGELVLPEYGIALEQSDGALCIFKGQEEIHGVMPILPIDEGFYRASIVFYTLAQLKHCYPYKEEVTRLNIKKRERAVKRANDIDPRDN
jgi:hypothetical protein